MGAIGAAIRDLPKIQQILTVTFQLIKAGLSLFEEPVMAVIRCAAQRQPLQ